MGAALAGPGLVTKGWEGWQAHVRQSISPSSIHPAHPVFTYPVPTANKHPSQPFFSPFPLDPIPRLIYRVCASLGPDACAPELPKRLDHHPSVSPSLRARRATAVPRRDPSLSCVLKSSADAAASRRRRGLLDRPCSAVTATGHHTHPSNLNDDIHNSSTSAAMLVLFKLRPNCSYISPQLHR